MLRSALYFAAYFLVLVAVFAILVLFGLALYGIAMVRSDAFGLFVAGYILIGVPAVLAATIWSARKRAT